MTSQFIEQFIEEWKAQETRKNLDLVMRVHSRIDRETRFLEEDGAELTDKQARLITTCQKIMERWAGYDANDTEERNTIREQKMRDLAAQFAEYGGGLVADYGISALQDDAS